MVTNNGAAATPAGKGGRPSGDANGVRLRPWGDGDLALLRLANTASMTEHLAGVESEAEIVERHERYLRLWREERARMFVVVDGGEPVGGIGWWGTEWEGRAVSETGWFVVPEAQGRGYGGRALGLLVDDARAHAKARVLMAFPAVANGASNGLCRRAGFGLRGVHGFAFRGSTLEVNAWALDLDGPAADSPDPDA